MSPFPNDAASAAPRRAAGPGDLPRAMLLGCGLALALTATQAWAVATRGTFFDPDDAMRAVEVRDFMVGQGWFDLVPRRLSPDYPFSMHWSRLVDLPLAAAQLALRPVLPPEAAERVVRLVEPIALFAATLFGLLRVVWSLAGPRAILPAAALAGTSFELLGNFVPGHIHHHGAQVTLLVGATAALLAAMAPRGGPGAAALAGLLIALSLGIGLQSLPFFVGLGAAAVLAWILDRWPAANLAGFGAGLCAILPVFLLDVPPARYAEAARDALSVAQLAGCLGGAALCLALAASTPRLPRPGRRLAAALVGGAGVATVLALWFPAVLGDPMADVDPMLRVQWLDGVGEALPLARLLALSPSNGAVLSLTLAGGLAATGAATLHAAPGDRPRWATLLALVAIGALGCLWQVRVAPSACALMMPALASTVLRVFDAVSCRPRAPALLAAVLAGLAGNGAGWSALAAPLASVGGASGAPGSASDCFEPANFAALAALPPALVLSSIDPGSAILAYTHHSALAAPYHRNATGNRVSLLALAAPPDAAWPIVHASRAGLLALCRWSAETVETAARHPDSLSAALLAGHAPDWLTPLGRPGDPYRLYRITDRRP